MRKDTRIKIKGFKTRRSELDNPVEPKQAMSVVDLFVAMVNGYDIPTKYSNGYDEDITIDEVGSVVQDTLDGMDYLNAVNQRAALAKHNAELAAAEVSIESTVTENVTE